MFWFPFIGLVIGVLLVGTGFACMQIGFRDHPNLLACLVLLVLTLVTGALHADGLADTADGVLGGATRERRLEIMRDSRIGSFGAIALILDYLLRFCAITQIVQIANHFILTATLLCLMPVVGRWSQVLGAGLCKYARPEEGIGKAFLDSVSWPVCFISAVIPLLLCVLTLGLTGLYMLVTVTVLCLLVVLYIWWRIGGMTGDTLGAVNEIAEVAFLLAFFCFYSPGMNFPALEFLLRFIKL
jgi:adenosylcobinamide-GDP ribazoletransferase